VLGDMLELGSVSEEAHQEMGRSVVAGPTRTLERLA